MEPKQIVNTDIVKKLNDNVFAVIGAENLIGFEKAYLIATAVGELKKLLTTEYMRPIMSLQGTKLGFKTDKDKEGGYPEAVVKNCLIEAVLTGVQPFGNQFNIIADNCYITKEGFGYMLANNKSLKGLYYDITPELPRINAGSTSAAIAMNIEYSFNGGVAKTKKIDIPVKMNAYMGTDAVIGKATRKARAWLFNTLTGSEIADGDTVDADARVMSTKINGVDNDILSFEDIEALLATKKDVLSPEDLVNANRILANKEEKSYPKLIKILQSK